MRSVAKRAGVSVATISRVLSGSPLVRPETAERVQRVLDEVGFVPNISATTLKYGRSDTYGVIIPDLTNPFFFAFLRDFEALLVKRHRGVLLANTEFSRSRTRESLRRMLARQVDGLVVMASEQELGPQDQTALQRVPMVTVDRRSVSPGTSDISFRYEHGMQLAVAHLFELGHRHIGFIGGNEELAVSHLRLGAFCAALASIGLAAEPSLIRRGNYRMDGGEREMRALLGLPAPPSAVITINDLTAFGALRAAHALGFDVPGQISLVGCDDIFLTEAVSPPLTTVHLSRRVLAEHCVEALESMTPAPELPGRQMWVETSLTVRSSTAAPAHARRRNKLR